MSVHKPACMAALCLRPSCWYLHACAFARRTCQILQLLITDAPCTCKPCLISTCATACPSCCSYESLLSSACTFASAQAPTSSGLFTSISAPTPVRSNADFSFTVAAGVAAGGSTAKPLRLVVQLPSTGITANSVAAPNTAGAAVQRASSLCQSAVCHAMVLWRHCSVVLCNSCPCFCICLLAVLAACVIAGAVITCTWPGDVAPADSKLVQVLATVGTASPLTITSTVTTDTAGVAPATQSVPVVVSAVSSTAGRFNLPASASASIMSHCGCPHCLIDTWAWS
jgi:hypothetical protein